MNSLSSSHLLRDLGWSGFGGECWAYAAVLAQVAEDVEAIVVVVNRAAWEKEGHIIGHACVLTKEGHYVDGDGEEKEWEDIEHWGMLDIEDSDYASFLETECEAEEILRFDFHEIEEFKKWFRPGFPEQMMNEMREGLKNPSLPSGYSSC